ncbi:MAG: hypothetical protein WBA38_04535 [Gordonia sp. (in: high G+C Gram-positive bacteria)]|uniref:hypothetical protein n=1 Tax=Gordonia sp. (in: high G+C Gram-positive bacteria) TaxID=84139 RepID=UPI003C74A8CA
MTLSLATQVGMIAAGLIFLWALLLGVWKYWQIMHSATGQAHIYVDIAHRAALMYSFATAMLAIFVQFSAWPSVVNVTALVIVVAFFVSAIAAYCLHGYKQDTTNQFHPTSPALSASMVALIIAEIGGSAVIIVGFIVEQARTWG